MTNLIQNDGIRQLTVQPLRDRDVGLGRVEGCRRGSSHNFGSKGSQDIHFLGAHLLRQDDDATVPLHGGSKSQPDA